MTDEGGNRPAESGPLQSLMLVASSCKPGAYEGLKKALDIIWKRQAPERKVTRRNMRTRAWAGAMFLALITPPARAVDDILVIESLCANVTQAFKIAPPLRIFAAFSDSDNETTPPRWREMPSVGDLKTASETSYPYSQAFLWSDHAATLIETFDTSPSGDWAQFVDYCFGDKGLLVRMVGTLNTFHAEGEESGKGVSRIKTSYFDKNGKVLRSDTRVLNLQTKALAPRAEFMDRTDSAYPSMRTMPFWNLIAE